MNIKNTQTYLKRIQKHFHMIIGKNRQASCCKYSNFCRTVPDHILNLGFPRMAKLYQVAVLASSTLLAHTAMCHGDSGPNTVIAPQMKRELPTRKMSIDSLQRTEYDVLIIGGGAVGAGCALDAATRGLKAALVEAEDFGSGTSSKSSKLLHGGIRDLDHAIKHLDLAAFRRVRSALKERHNIASMAPHLNQPVPIMIPVHHWWQAPIYWLKLHLYHLLAPRGGKGFYFINADASQDIFPMIRRSDLVGSFILHEGQHDDARMCLSVALTAARYGADICNHMKVVELLRNKKNAIVGAKVVDQMTGRVYKVRSKIVINATGPFSDSVRRMEDPTVQPMCMPSWCSHIVLPGFYCPEEVGIFDPNTKDGRTIFFLPWQGHTLMGTTDAPSDVSTVARPTENEVQFLLEDIKNYVSPHFDVRRCDVLAAWGGFKPLPVNSGTLKRTPLQSHIINLSAGNMISIVGGTWTSFRLVAERAVNAAIKYGKLEPMRLYTITQYCKLDGATGWSPNMFIRLVQDFGIEKEVAKHLSDTYGSNAFKIAERANATGKSWPIVGKRLHSEFPYIEAEVRQGVKDYAVTLEDMMARRLRVAFLNVQVAEQLLPQIANIMAEELKWSKEYKNKQIREAKKFLVTQMGKVMPDPTFVSIPVKMSVRQVQKYARHFRNMDEDSTGYVSISKCCKAMKDMGVKEVPVDLMHNVLRDIDSHSQGKVNLYEFLLLMSAVVQGDTAYLRYAKMHMDKKVAAITETRRRVIPVEQTGGGL
ncbi:glycerol-3-phosphate dehydrogenase, mitochondrial [Scaptodrosophila lebanonensis]|uniref:Glycerol-3-phosphate dehydrogenase n=1 Tax=Drosophila lebanonensis TaxID=7225 RepID=A0A6J2U6D7_DROLE|nr:glycerol-3-phosphate dehydrogenase, mitochondrial [Scaptodrosophila lebanonensis]